MQAPESTSYKVLSETELALEWEKFEKIIYNNLEKILDKRTSYPVTKFAKR